MNRDLRELATYLVAFLLPLGALVIFAAITRAPAPTAAEVAAPAPVQLPPSGAAAWTEVQRAAGRHAAALRDEPFGPTPMFYHPGREPTPPDPVPGPAPDPLAVPKFRIQVIYASPTGSVALIDGKQYRDGDAVGDSGWVVVEIDGEARLVRFEHAETGREVVVTMDRPLQQEQETPRRDLGRPPGSPR